MMDTILNIIDSEFAYAMSWTIIHSIWQGLLIAFLIQISFKSFKFKSAAHKHNIAFGALILIFGLSVTTFFNHWIEATQTNTLILSDVVPSFTANELVTAIQEESGFIESLSVYGPWITAFWLLGFILLAIKTLLNLSGVYSYKRESSLLLEKTWTTEFKLLLDKFKIDKKIEIRHSVKALGVCTFGYFEPIILIPTAIINAIPPEEIKHILAHELSHIKRNDYLINLIQVWIETLMYYNPGVYFISKMIRRQRELACDQNSISLTRNNIAYAKTLLKLSQYTQQEKSITLAFSNNQSDFEERIKAILNWKEKIYSSKNKWFMKTLTLSLMTIILFAFQYPSIELNATENQNSIDNEESIEALIDQEDGDFKIQINDFVSTLEKVEPKQLLDPKTKRQSIIELDTASKNDYKINVIIDDNSNFASLEHLEDKLALLNADTLPKKLNQEELEEIMEMTKESLENAFEKLEDSNIFYFDNDEVFPENFFKDKETEKAMESLFERLSEMEFDNDRFFKLKELEHQEIEDLQAKLESSMNIFSDSLSKLNEFFMDTDFNALIPEALTELEHLHLDEMIAKELHLLEDHHWPERDNVFFYNRGIDEVFEDKLVELGLINKGESFKIELSQDKLKINGKKQPETLRNEFLKLYKQNKGKALSKNSKFKYELDID